MRMKLKMLLLAAAVILLVTGSFLAQEKKEEAQSPAASSSQAAPASSPHSYEISPEDAAKKNPIRFTDASVDRGKKVFKTQCALCHGEKGDLLATIHRCFAKPDRVLLGCVFWRYYKVVW